jgi:hypothetical protein
MEPQAQIPTPRDFTELAASRRAWIDDILRPWCRQAVLAELRKAAAEWFDIAGRADADATLWSWAWERFPDLTHADLKGVNETHEVCVVLRDGRELYGFPDNRASRLGMLVLVSVNAAGEYESAPPVEIDRIASVRRTSS